MTYTDAQRARLAQLAGAVALEAPLREGSASYTAKIPWDLINKIRAVMDESGFDWRTQHAKVAASNKAERARRLVAISRRRARGADGYPVEVPDDTPSLDDSFHRHEMDV